MLNIAQLLELVGLGTPLFLRNRSFRVRDSHLNTADTPEAQTRIQELETKLGRESFVPTYDYTGIGEAYAAFSIGQAGYYRVDESTFPVLEFSMSTLTDWQGRPALTQGRIYGQFAGKPVEFEKWLK